MGSLEGFGGAWGYVQGGMGALSDAIASSATAHGVSIFTEKVNSPLTPTPIFGKYLRIEHSRRFGGSLVYWWTRLGLGSADYRWLSSCYPGLSALNLHYHRTFGVSLCTGEWADASPGSAGNRQGMRKL